MATRNIKNMRNIIYQPPFRTLILGLLVSFLLVACATPETTATCPEADCPEATCPQPIRYEDLWSQSGHADLSAEPFNHWNEAEPQEIPVECAKCHSRPGFIDFLGVDGSDVGRVDQPAKIGTTVTCFVCHNEATDNLSSTTFPSGKIVKGLGPEGRCVQCHQGLASARTVDQTLKDAGLDSDAVSSSLEFINSHAISGATPFGTEVQGAYEYAGQTYHGRFHRGDEFFACIDCHDPHSLELKIETCSDCHTILEPKAREIRVDTTDYDGDGNTTEGIADEVDAFLVLLFDSIQDYASNVSGTPLAYNIKYYPYFFVDTNEDGKITEDEAVFPNRYNAWTPRLLKAAYNYNYVQHDPGAFAHNSNYVLQVLYDSLNDIGADTSNLSRPE